MQTKHDMKRANGKLSINEFFEHQKQIEIRTEKEFNEFVAWADKQEREN